MLALRDAKLAAGDELSIQPAISADRTLDRTFSLEPDLSLHIRHYEKIIFENVSPANPLFSKLDLQLA